jgi:hypothetical protein
MRPDLGDQPANQAGESSAARREFAYTPEADRSSSSVSILTASVRTWPTQLVDLLMQ